MVGLPKIGTWCGLFTGLALVYATGSSAQDRETNAMSSSATLFRPPTLQVQDVFYRDYFSGADEAIRLAYADRWTYHETQSSFTQSWNPVHLDIGTFTQPGVGPREVDVRAEFARAAFRMRLESAFRKFLAREENKGIRNVHRVVENLKAQSFKTSDSATAAEVRFGWDVLTDASRLEYVKGERGMGFYHSSFSSIGGGARKLRDPLAFNTWTSLGTDMPSASLGYAFGPQMVSLGMSKALTPSVVANVKASTPALKNSGAPSEILARIIYRF